MKITWFTLAISLLCLCFSSFLFYVHSKEKTYCLSQGTWLEALNSKNNPIGQNTCQGSDCNQEICNMLWYKPGIASLKISLLEPTTPPMNFNYVDIVWSLLICCNIVLIVIQICEIWRSYTDNEKDEKDTNICL